MLTRHCLIGEKNIATRPKIHQNVKRKFDKTKIFQRMIQAPLHCLNILRRKKSSIHQVQLRVSRRTMSSEFFADVGLVGGSPPYELHRGFNGGKFLVFEV